ncbi:MAG: YHS domain-containing protein [Chthonomonadales bacterium]|nr:YHS domain-containing protein [Chthonomonadales bacterium]
MRFLAPAAAIAALLAALAVAGPAPKQTKSKASCPMNSAQAKGDACPMAKSAKCADCPSAEMHAECAGASHAASKTAAAKAKPGTVVLQCETGARVINIKAATKAKRFVDYKNKRYYFACDGCAASFKADPAAYAREHKGFAIPRAKQVKSGV